MSGGLGVDAFVEGACVGEGVAGFESKGSLVECVIGFGMSSGEFVDIEELLDGLKGLTALEQGLGGAHPVDQDKCFDALPEEFFGLGGGGGGDGCEQGNPVVGLSEDLEGLHLSELGFRGVWEGLDHHSLQSTKALSEGLFALEQVGLLDQRGRWLGVFAGAAIRQKQGWPRRAVFEMRGRAIGRRDFAMALPEAHLTAQEVEARMIDDLCGRCRRMGEIGGGIWGVGSGGGEIARRNQGRAGKQPSRTASDSPRRNAALAVWAA